MSGQEAVVFGMAGRYATALFDLAQEAGALGQVEDDMASMRSLFKLSDDLRAMVRSPVYSRAEQGAAMAAVLEKAGVSQLTRNFVGVVTENRRLFALPDMISVFEKLLSQHRGEISASVTSARALSGAQVEALKAALKEAMGRDVQMTAEVDKTLLGGLVVKVGSRMIDSSLATKLNSLQIAMKET